MTDDPFAAFEEIGIPYETVLGHFISMYSLAERALKAVLVRETRVSGVVARAIFSGTRTDQASQFIRRCYEARNKAVPAGLAEALEHLTVITALRNDLLHYGVEAMAASAPGNRIGWRNRPRHGSASLRLRREEAYVDTFK